MTFARNQALRLLLIASLAALAACSTVETSGSGLAAVGSNPDERIQLKVRTGDARMDPIVYEMAFEAFSKVMPLREAPPFTSNLEVTFASSTQSAFFGSASTLSTASASATGWYSGVRASGIGTASTLAAGGVFDWQNSTMLAVLRRADGERLWSADYSYKGGWEMSGLVVNTPDEAARLVAKRLAARYAADSARR